MITREFNLYLHAGHSTFLVINVNQYDQGEQWLFTLFNADGTQYVPSSGAIVGIKSDNLGIINSGTVDSQGRVVINETQQMTASVGKAVFELLIDSQTHGTANFVVLVEEKPGNNADMSESDLSLLQEAIDATSPLPTGGTVGQVLTKTANGSAWSDAGTPTQAQVAEAVSDWADENITVTTGVVIDQSLSVQGAAADAKATGDSISDLMSQISQLIAQGGVTNAMKTAFMNLVNHLLFDEDDPTGQTYIDALYDAFYPPATLTGISAVYTQGETEVLSTDSLDVLKSGLVVTGLYDDSSTRVINGYTLSGTLTSPIATITVTYEGFTTTFTVENVTYVDNSLYNWDFTQSLTDSKQGRTATVASNATQSESGLSIGTSSAVGMVKFGGIDTTTLGQFTIEIDVTSFKVGGTGNYALLRITNSSYSKNTGIMFRVAQGYWAIKDESEAYLGLSDLTSYNMFNGKTLKLQVDNDISKTYKLYCDNVLVGEKTVTALSGTKYLSLDGFNNSIFTGLRIYEGLV